MNEPCLLLGGNQGYNRSIQQILWEATALAHATNAEFVSIAVQCQDQDYLLAAATFFRMPSAEYRC